MLPGWIIVTAALGYLLLLFAVASYGDRITRLKGVPAGGRPVVYALSLGVYCTSWTYFGGVGLAAERGLEYMAIYIGPILMYTLGMPILRRIVELAKTEKITSGADFVAARYGKNPVVGMLVTGRGEVLSGVGWAVGWYVVFFVLGFSLVFFVTGCRRFRSMT